MAGLSQGSSTTRTLGSPRREQSLRASRQTRQPDKPKQHACSTSLPLDHGKGKGKGKDRGRTPSSAKGIAQAACSGTAKPRLSDSGSATAQRLPTREGCAPPGQEQAAAEGPGVLHAPRPGTARCPLDSEVRRNTTHTRAHPSTCFALVFLPSLQPFRPCHFRRSKFPTSQGEMLEDIRNRSNYLADFVFAADSC